MNRIRDLRKQEGLSQKELAARLKFSQNTISQWETGARTLDVETAKKLASFFHVSISYLLNEPSSSPAATRIPLLGVVAAGIPIEAIENIEDYEEIPAEWGTDKEYFALRVRGDSMEPLICDGDRVIVQKLPCVDSGQIAVILVNGCEATVKQVKLMKDGVMLVGMNPAAYSPCFYTAEEIEKLPIVILGRVVEIRRSV